MSELRYKSMGGWSNFCGFSVDINKWMGAYTNGWVGRSTDEWVYINGRMGV